MHVRNARIHTTASIVALAIAAAGFVGLASVPGAAAAPVPLRAVVNLSPATTTVNQLVTAGAGKSTVPAGDTLSSITLNWGDGTNSVTLGSLKALPQHHYQRPGRFTVGLSLTDHKGTKVHGTALEVVNAPSGSYSGLNPQNSYPITFYVSADHTKLQEVYISAVGMTCAPGGSPVTGHLGIGTIALNADGSFNATTTQLGVFAGSPATFSYTFKGSVSGVSASGAPKASGTFRETLAYIDTAARNCTSNNQSWTATRDVQPAQPTTPPPSGSYSGLNPQNSYPITFYVSADHTKLQEVYISAVGMTCTPGDSTVTDHLAIATIPLLAGGSFNTTTTQTGVYRGFPATFTYTFSGNVHGVDKSGTPRVAGTFRENLAFTDTAARNCTSNNQSWTATRDVQPAQPTTPPPSGSYSGLNPQNSYPITFHVSSATQLQTIDIAAVGLSCSPGGANLTDHFTIANITLNADGSFGATAVHSGVISGHAATFTYTFKGNFHGVDNDGAPRASGTFRDDISYTDSALRTCSSNNQAFTTVLTSLG